MRGILADADFAFCLDSISRSLDIAPLPVTEPVYSPSRQLTGFLDLLTRRYLPITTDGGGTASWQEIPDSSRQQEALLAACEDLHARCALHSLALAPRDIAI
jgi:hypothetical protein